MSADDRRARDGVRDLAVVISLADARARVLARAKRRHPSVAAPPRPGGDAA